MIANGWRILAAAALLAGLAGCGETAMRITGTDAVLPRDDGSSAFLDRVSANSTVTENDALRGVLLLLDGKDESADFGRRVEALRTKNVLDGSWDFEATRPVTRGRLAYMVCQACEIRGGVILQLTGPSQRYCLRELQYRGFMSPGVPYQPVTGLEFVAVLTRADTYLETGKIPNVLSTETAP